MALRGIPQNTIAVLQKYHFNFQKKFGQNFLIDTTVLDRIISSAEITKEDCVLEIGPGHRHHDTVSGRACRKCSGGGDRQGVTSDPGGDSAGLR